MWKEFTYRYRSLNVCFFDLLLNAAVQMWNTVIRVCTVHRNKSCETNQGNKGVQNVYKSDEALYMSAAA